MNAKIFWFFIAQLIYLHATSIAYSQPIGTELTTPWLIYQGNERANTSAVIPSQLNGWQKYDGNRVPSGFNRTVWFKNQLPQDLTSDSALLFDNGLEDIAVYVGDQRIYQYGQVNYHAP
jgi:hypothetical protein